MLCTELVKKKKNTKSTAWYSREILNKSLVLCKSHSVFLPCSRSHALYKHVTGTITTTRVYYNVDVCIDNCTICWWKRQDKYLRSTLGRKKSRLYKKKEKNPYQDHYTLLHSFVCCFFFTRDFIMIILYRCCITTLTHICVYNRTYRLGIIIWRV